MAPGTEFLNNSPLTLLQCPALWQKGHKRPLSGLSSHTIIREDERRGFVWNRRDRWPPPPFPASPDKVYHAQTAEVSFWISFSLNNHVLSMFLTESLKWTNHSWLYFLLIPCFCIQRLTVWMRLWVIKMTGDHASFKGHETLILFDQLGKIMHKIWSMQIKLTDFWSFVEKNNDSKESACFVFNK